MAKGKLIVIEGCDGSGKATQTALLYKELMEKSINVKKIEFPNYESASSSLVKMYLEGDFGTDPLDVNPYAASTFYAVDRFSSFKTIWGHFYNDGGVVIADRYVTANMIHQASKFNDNKEKDSFLDWLYDLEYIKYQLPVPDMVIFLNMDPDISEVLMKERENKFTGEAEKDIHEKDKNYLVKSYNNAIYVCKKYNWCIINCFDSNGVRSIEDINKDIYNAVIKII